MELRTYVCGATGEALWAWQGRTEVLTQDARERRLGGHTGDVAQGARTASGAHAGDVAQWARTASGAHAGLVGQDPRASVTEL